MSEKSKKLSLLNAIDNNREGIYSFYHLRCLCINDVHFTFTEPTLITIQIYSDNLFFFLSNTENTFLKCFDINIEKINDLFLIIEDE